MRSEANLFPFFRMCRVFVCKIKQNKLVMKKKKNRWELSVFISRLFIGFNIHTNNAVDIQEKKCNSRISLVF